jgi:putative flippase GtrA
MLRRPTRSAARRRETWLLLGRHQLASLATTVVDFGTMIVLVQAFLLSPTIGTAVGAPVGGITNFLLCRGWIFEGHSGTVASQALRYALVSAASAGWNTLGEHLATELTHVPYVLARAAVAIVVSFLWNFPMHRYFVFPEARTS